MYQKRIKTPRITAIISSYNRGVKIKQTINSLLSQTLPLTKIIVIDDGSQRGKQVPSFSNTKVQVIRLEKNVGVVWGRNLALSKVSESDYALIIDDDISLEKNAVRELLKTFDENSDAVAAMPVVYFLSNKDRVWSAGSGVNLLTGQTLFDTAPFKNKYAKIAAATSVLIVKTKVLIKAGWYDPLYYFCYEDADFYYRLKEKGKGEIYSVRTAYAYHDIPEDLSLERVAKRSYHIGRGRILFMSRHSSYFPFNVPFIILFALYYEYIGLKFGSLLSGYRYLLGVIDGLNLVITNRNNSSLIKFKKNLSLSYLTHPENLRSTKVRE